MMFIVGKLFCWGNENRLNEIADKQISVLTSVNTFSRKRWRKKNWWLNKRRALHPPIAF